MSTLKESVISKPSTTKKTSPFIPLLLVFILWRLAFLTFTHPQFFADNYEEIYRGTVAREMLTQTHLPLWDYRPDNYSGGFYVIVILLAAFLKLFGYSMLTFKSISIAIGALTLLTWFFTLKKHLNPTAAWIFAGLFIFAPQSVTGLSSSVLGDHAETLLLSALSVLLFFKFYYGSDERKTTFLTFGLLAGFSLWFAYIYGLTLITILIFQTLHARKAKIIHLVYVSFSFVLGFSLWLFLYKKNAFQSFEVQGAPIWKSFSLEYLIGPFISWKKIIFARLFLETRHRPMGLFYGINLGIYFLFITLSTLLALINHSPDRELAIQPRPPRAEKFFFIAIIVHLIACQFYDAAGLRFLLPCYPFFIAWIASRLSHLGRIPATTRNFIIWGLIASGILSTTARFSLSYPGEFLTRKPYSLATLGFSPIPIPERIKFILKQTTPEETLPDRVSAVMALVSQANLENESEIQTLKNEVPLPLQPFFDFFLERERLMRRGLSQENAKDYAEADTLSHSATDLSALFKELRENSSKPGFFRPDFLKTTGTYLFDTWEKDPQNQAGAMKPINDLPIQMQNEIYQGVGYRLAEKFLYSFSSPFNWQWKDWRNISHESPGLYQGLRIALDVWQLPPSLFPEEIRGKL